MLKKALLLAFAVSCAFSALAQTTQITASHIAYFGGAPVTGSFCVTPTDSTGNPINLVTSTGQQFAPNQPLCFPIVAGVLSSSAIVADTSLSQPVNACLKLTAYNNLNQQIANYPCLQPSGATWSFDAYVPTVLPNIPALTAPQFQLNGTALGNQLNINFVASGATSSGGTITFPTGGAVSSITTTGTSGPATLASGILNIPNYASTGSSSALASAHLTSQAAAISNTTLCTSGVCSAAAEYSIYVSLIQTGTACSSVTAGAVIPSITWTDTNGTAHTATIPQLLSGLRFGTSLANAFASGTLNVSTNGSAISYSTAYTACTTGTGTYQMDVAIAPAGASTGISGGSTSIATGTILGNVSGVTAAASALTAANVASLVSSYFDAAGAATTAQTASLQKSSNLSDLASASTARTNLGLVASATTDTTNASNISSGTLAAARVATLNQPTTANAGTASALASTPTLCSTGNAPTGILANGNATGCAAISGGGASLSAANTWSALQTFPANDISIAGVTATGATGTGNNVFSASPTLTGTPLAPTPAVATNSTQIGTTAFDYLLFAAPPTAGYGSTTPEPVAATTVTATTSVSVGSSPPTACGTAAACSAGVEASTAGTPTAGQDYCRWDSTTHTRKCSVNGGSEVVAINGLASWHLVQAPTTLTAQAASIAATTLYTPSATGWYRVCMNYETTTAATTSSTSPYLEVPYTSAIDSVARIAVIGTNGGNTTNSTTSNATDTGCSGPIQVLTSTALQYATVGYVSSGATAMKYGLTITVEVLQ